MRLWTGLNRRGAPLAVSTAAAVLLATACTSGGESVGSDGEPVEGGELVTYTSQTIFSFDPAQVQAYNYGAQGGYMQALYDTLVYVDREDNEIKPGLAESLLPVEGTNCAEWELTLRSGVEFTDGTPLDAEAVAFNWERIQDPDTISPQAPNLADVAFEPGDELVLDITLPQPNCAFDRLVAGTLPFVASPTAIEEHGEEFEENPVGAGPFVLGEWDPATGDATMERNPDYYEEGKPHLDAITFTEIGDGSTAVDTIASGQVHVMSTGVSGTDVDEAEAAGLQVDLLPISGGGGYQFNTAQAPFDELCAREAVAYGLDPAGIDEALNTSEIVGGPTYGLFEEDSPFYEPDIEFPSNDPERAEAAAEECADMDNPVQFTITALTGNDQQLGEYVASRLNTIEGIEVEVETISLADAYTTIFVNRDYHLTSYPGGMRFTDPNPLFDSWLATDGTLNLTGYSSEEMDEALQELRAAEEEADRAEALREVQELWTRDIPLWIHSAPVSYFIYANDVTGVEPVNGGNDFLLLQNLALTE